MLIIIAAVDNNAAIEIFKKNYKKKTAAINIINIAFVTFIINAIIIWVYCSVYFLKHHYMHILYSHSIKMPPETQSLYRNDQWIDSTMLFHLQNTHHPKE